MVCKLIIYITAVMPVTDAIITFPVLVCSAEINRRFFEFRLKRKRYASKWPLDGNSNDFMPFDRSFLMFHG